jgi:putative heme-binding domain-containing protein
VRALLAAMEEERIGPTVLNASRRSRLAAHRDPAIRDRATALFSGLDAAGPMQAYDRLRPDVLARRGQPGRGAPLYTMHCVACHTFGGGDGGRAGPDLSGIRNQPADAILLHVLVPDHEITPGYDAYTVETRDGRSLFGRLESEAPHSITLRDAASQPHVVLRTDIVSMTAAPASLMPAGFDEVMSPQDLADLIAYLKAP